MKILKRIFKHIFDVIRKLKERDEMENIYMCDFETTTDAEDCRVWSWGAYNVYTESFVWNNSIKSFFDWLFELPERSKIYFHNLKFDSEFMEYWLFENGFTCAIDRPLEKQYSILMTDMNVFYSMNIKNYNKNFVIYDSLKLLPFPVARLSKAFGIEQMKGEIDYHKFRPVGYVPDSVEIEYLKNDVVIVGKALRFFFDQGLTKMTLASNALSDFKGTMGRPKYFRKYFPVLEMDEELRASYKGGITYANKKIRGKIIGDGIVLDVNSLYPWVMRNMMLPYGHPVRYNGQYINDEIYPLFIQFFRCSFELKENHIPMLQLKNNSRFYATQYLESSDNLEVEMMMTSVELELFLEHYEVFNVEYMHGWKFKQTNMFFIDYIDKWGELKKQSSIDGNIGLRSLAKLMLNSLYGKFGLNPKVQGKYSVFIDGMVKHINGEEDTREPLYIPIASFITSYARAKTVRGAQSNYDRFLYCDTDSLHLTGTDLPNNLDIDDNELGAWAHEDTFTKGKYLRAKCYIEEIDGNVHVTVAGMPDSCHSQVTFDNFEFGLTVTGKKSIKHVIGGSIIEDTEYTLKE